MLKRSLLRPIAKSNSFEPIGVVGVASSGIGAVFFFVDVHRQMHLIRSIDLIWAIFV